MARPRPPPWSRPCSMPAGSIPPSSMAASSMPMAPMRGWARATGSWSRPMKATAPSCACRPRFRSSPISIPIISIITAASRRCAKPSSSFVEHVPFYGFAVMCLDHPEVQAMVGQIQRPPRHHLWLQPPGRCPRRQCQLLRRRLAFRCGGHRPAQRHRNPHREDAPAHAGRAQCAECAGRHRRGARAWRRRRHDPHGLCRFRRRRAAASPASANGTAPPSSTITATTPSRSPPR